MKEYIEMKNGGYYILGKRVSLDSIVYALRRGESAEEIKEAFSVLTIEEINGGIAFYWANQEEVDRSILEEEIEFDKWSRQNKEENKDWYERRAAARKELVLEQR